MKKLLLLVISILFLTNLSNAQNDDIVLGKNIQVGIKAGVNLSNVYDTKGEEFEADSKFGFVVGVFGVIPVWKKFGIQPEILFSQKGFKGTGSILTYKYNFIRTSNFIDIPLFISFKPVKLVTLLAGPQFSYLFKQNDSFDDGISNIIIEEEFKNEDVRNNLVCFVFGGDLNFEYVVFGVRAGWDIQNNNKDGSSSTPRYKNVWYQATIGLKF
ncbi:MAG: hypothetical protein A2W99_03590 [Bacteroidetes bacterium GWF2_33_16]|nr:MAG: hypothetical protein A2X00_11480 [Bacteroidetes bacterium GWE2_32_14]OFY08268.1 MAG: hypothetical protein A2W99_03590 [Bacteroidetes bacterium GWF2_33_16]